MKEGTVTGSEVSKAESVAFETLNLTMDKDKDIENRSSAELSGKSTLDVRADPPGTCDLDEDGDGDRDGFPPGGP